MKLGKKVVIFWYIYICCCVWIDDKYYLLGDVYCLYRKIEIGLVVNILVNNLINVVFMINLEFDEYFVEYIK